MKKLVYVISLLIYIFTDGAGQENKLLLLSSSDYIILGETLDLQLTIENIDTRNIIMSGDFDLEKTTNQFIHEFSIIPKSEGKLILGPYYINYNNRELTSNQLIIKVADKGIKENNIAVKLPKKANTGEIVGIEILSFKTSLNQITLVENPAFETRGTSENTSIQMKNGLKTVEYKKVFNVIFTKPGEFTIDSKWFKNVPEYFLIQGDKITIE